MKIHVLSIDPGDTTGWCILTTEGKIVDTGAASIEELPQLWERLKREYAQATTTRPLFPSTVPPLFPSTVLLVVAERFSARTLAVQKYGDMYRLITEAFPGVVWVTPGVWKTTKTAILALRKGKPPILDTVHQFDAFRLGLWFIDNYLKKGETEI